METCDEDSDPRGILYGTCHAADVPQYVTPSREFADYAGRDLGSMPASSEDRDLYTRTRKIGNDMSPAPRKVLKTGPYSETSFMTDSRRWVGTSNGRESPGEEDVGDTR